MRLNEMIQTLEEAKKYHGEQDPEVLVEFRGNWDDRMPVNSVGIKRTEEDNFVVLSAYQHDDQGRRK